MHTNSDSQICVYMDTYDYVYDVCVCVILVHGCVLISTYASVYYHFCCFLFGYVLSHPFLHTDTFSLCFLMSVCMF